jgi:hypothetical protein
MRDRAEREREMSEKKTLLQPEARVAGICRFYHFIFQQLSVRVSFGVYCRIFKEAVGRANLFIAKNDKDMRKEEERRTKKNQRANKHFFVFFSIAFPNWRKRFLAAKRESPKTFHRFAVALRETG